MYLVIAVVGPRSYPHVFPHQRQTMQFVFCTRSCRWVGGGYGGGSAGQDAVESRVEFLRHLGIEGIVHP